MKSEEKTKADQVGLEQTTKPPEIIDKVQNACPRCHYANETGAIFCEECGASLHQPAPCPHCGAPARPRADICEVCGEWLLKGQCKFCYAPIDDDEVFCGECGNPAAGIVCVKCGEMSIFDFCKTCGIPLSIQAKQMARETAENPAFQEIISLFEQISGIGAPISTSDIETVQVTTDPISTRMPHDEHASKLKAYREASHISVTEHKPKSATKNLFSSDQKKSIGQLADEVAQEEERRRIEEERRRQEEERRRQEEERKRREEEERRRQEAERRRQEEERRRERERKLQEQLSEAMSKLRGKTFSSNQEARRFFMNIIAGLPEEIAKKITNSGMSWRCNAYDCVHDSPNDCADPSRGGVWMIR